jgi:hypothetical protein
MGQVLGLDRQIIIRYFCGIPPRARAEQEYSLDLGSSLSSPRNKSENIGGLVAHG